MLELKAKYRTCISQNLWTSTNNQKKDTTNELAAMKASINKLVQKVENSGNNQNTGKKKNKKNMDNVTCFKFGKKGYFIWDCTDDKPDGKSSSAGTTKKPDWHHVLPKEENTHKTHEQK